MTEPGYIFNNDSPHAPAQHALLSRLLDPITTGRFRRLKAGQVRECLEVGAGAGTVARWLADHIGPDGRVVATDINTRYLAERPNLTVLQHDIAIDPLPTNAFDLVHARLVLLHLPQRHTVLRRLHATLKPGGTLFLEEFDCGYAPVLCLPQGADPTIFPKFNQALTDHLSAAGADPLWGRHAARALTATGFNDIDVEVHLAVWPAGSPGCELHRSNSLHLREGLCAHGLTDADLIALRTQLRTRGFLVSSYPIYSVSGRKHD